MLVLAYVLSTLTDTKKKKKKKGHFKERTANTGEVIDIIFSVNVS